MDAYHFRCRVIYFVIFSPVVPLWLCTLLSSIRNSTFGFVGRSGTSYMYIVYVYMKFRFPRMAAHETIDGEFIISSYSAVISHPAQSIWHQNGCASAFRTPTFTGGWAMG